MNYELNSFKMRELHIELVHVGNELSQHCRDESSLRYGLTFYRFVAAIAGHIWPYSSRLV